MNIKIFRTIIMFTVLYAAFSVPAYSEMNLTSSFGFRIFNTESKDSKETTQYNVTNLTISLDIQAVIQKHFNVHVYYAFPSFFTELRKRDGYYSEVLSSSAFDRMHAFSFGLGYTSKPILLKKDTTKPVQVQFSVGPLFMIYWYDADYLTNMFNLSTIYDRKYQTYDETTFNLGLEGTANFSFVFKEKIDFIIGINFANIFPLHTSEVKTSSRILIRDDFLISTAFNFGFQFTF